MARTPRRSVQARPALRRSRLVLAAAAIASLLLAPGLALSDDTDLFSTVVPPNVILLVDNSGSMHHVVWHPDYNPAVAPTCTFFTNTSQYSVSTFSGDTDGPSSSGDTTFQSGTFSLPGTPAGCIAGSREIFHDPAVDATGNYTRWMGSYLNWYFSAAADAAPAPTPATEILVLNNGLFSTCLGGGTYSLYKRSRITASKDILREVICQVNAAGEVRFGLAQFRRPIFPDIDTGSSDPNGGYVAVPAEDYLDGTGSPNVYTLNGSSQSHGAHLDDAIDDLTGESWTPLAETLFQVYTYFMSRTSGERPNGVAGTFPEYEYGTSQSSGQGGPFTSTGAPDSPVEHDCQKNFVVIITDGEPTRDDFDLNLPTNTAVSFGNFGTLIGDFNGDGEDETPGDFPGCTGCEATRWLDDIAKFMQETDFRPDLDPHNGNEQVIDVYTVGFTTSPFANAVLQKTADQGNGQFYFSTDPEQLATDIVSAVTDIIQKSQSFTAATVPAVRTADGGKFYTSLFVPSNLDGFWEGHLKSWTINADGTIYDADSPPKCALNDPTGDCLSGAFLSSAVPFWDAGERLNTVTPGTRSLRTSVNSGPLTSSMVLFDSATMTPANMGLAVTDIPTYDTAPHVPPVDEFELTTMVVDNIRGCELGTFGGGCIKRPWLLGDIFHSNPVVVPGPQSFFGGDLSYDAFETNYETRDRMIIAGANDGFLHFFDAGIYGSPVANEYGPGTGDEVVGFMPYAARQNAKFLPIDSNGRNNYFVDGSSSVADVWLYQGATTNSPKDGSDWQRWRTVLVGGMRQGGRSYYALDISNPGSGTCQTPATGPGYPCYLWEFPREDDVATPGSLKSYMGLTFSEPVIC